VFLEHFDRILASKAPLRLLRAEWQLLSRQSTHEKGEDQEGLVAHPYRDICRSDNQAIISGTRLNEEDCCGILSSDCVEGIWEDGEGMNKSEEQGAGDS
jgi:hypothetical protein